MRTFTLTMLATMWIFLQKTKICGSFQTLNYDGIEDKIREQVEKNQEFLETVVNYDEAIMYREMRGIVDTYLQALSNGSLTGLFLGNQGDYTNSLNTLGTLLTNTTSLQPTMTPNTFQMANKSATASASATQTKAPVAIRGNSTNLNSLVNILRPSSPATTQGNGHLFDQVTKVVVNAAKRNVSGIVDESLKIASPPPVRNLVNNIMKVFYCNTIRRLLGRC